MPRAESAPSEGAGCWEYLRQASVRVPGRRPRALLDSQTHRDLRPTFALPWAGLGPTFPFTSTCHIGSGAPRLQRDFMLTQDAVVTQFPSKVTFRGPKGWAFDRRLSAQPQRLPLAETARRAGWGGSAGPGRRSCRQLRLTRAANADLTFCGWSKVEVEAKIREAGGH